MRGDWVLLITTLKCFWNACLFVLLHHDAANLLPQGRTIGTHKVTTPQRYSENCVFVRLPDYFKVLSRFNPGVWYKRQYTWAPLTWLCVPFNVLSVPATVLGCRNSVLHQMFNTHAVVFGCAFSRAFSEVASFFFFFSFSRKPRDGFHATDVIFMNSHHHCCCTLNRRWKCVRSIWLVFFGVFFDVKILCLYFTFVMWHILAAG